MKNGKDILYEVAFTTQSKIIECKWLQKVWMEQTENGSKEFLAKWKKARS